jgi:hypothetical protein
MHGLRIGYLLRGNEIDLNECNVIKKDILIKQRHSVTVAQSFLLRVIMINKFHKITDKLVRDNELEIYHPAYLLYKASVPYILLTLPLKASDRLIFSKDLIYTLDEQHITIFSNLEETGEQSAFHYTAKLNSVDGHYVYRLRVFFNDKDQPTGVSWYRKATYESDELYLPVELKTREMKICMDFAADRVKFPVEFIRTKKVTMVMDAKERYQTLRKAYEQLVDEQSAVNPFSFETAMEYIQDMKICLSKLNDIGVTSIRWQWAYLMKLEALALIANQPVAQNEEANTSHNSVVEAEESDVLLISNTFENISAITPEIIIDTSMLEKRFADISAKHASVPAAFKIVPATTRKILNEEYLMFLEQLQDDYRECCEMFLLTLENKSSRQNLKHYKELNHKMDLISKEQETIQNKYVQTILLFADETPDFIERLQGCKTPLESIMVNSIKLLIRNNKSDFLQLVLDNKQLSSDELVEVIKVILTTENATECLNLVLKKYRISTLLLQKDSNNVILASYIFRLPMVNSMRLACVYDIPALSSSSFYKKLLGELRLSRNDELYDTTTLERDIENARIAENLYANSSEQKHQIRQNIEWVRQLPASIQSALGRMSFEPNSSCHSKAKLFCEISQEINSALSILSKKNPEFVRRLKHESKSQMQQFKTEMFQNEESFVDYLNSIDATRLESDLDLMINYAHLLNNYLKYCLPNSYHLISESEVKELRDYYFNELKSFGINNNPFEKLSHALTAVSSALKELSSALTHNLKCLEGLQRDPSESNIEKLVEVFDNLCAMTEGLDDLPEPPQLK